MTEGIITCFLGGKEREVEEKVKKSNKIFGSNNLFLSKNDLRDIVISDRYLFGIKKDNAFHFHPLNFMKSLASECTAKGAKISEKSHVCWDIDFACILEGFWDGFWLVACF